MAIYATAKKYPLALAGLVIRISQLFFEYEKPTYSFTLNPGHTEPIIQLFVGRRRK